MGEEFDKTDREVFGKLVDFPEATMMLIYELYIPKMILYIRKFIKNDETIEDIVSETIQVLWEKRKEAIKVQEPYYWMSRIALNIALDKIKENQKYKQVPLEESYSIASDEEADFELLKEELKDQIREVARMYLTPREQEVFLASKLDGLNIDEIMERFNLAEQTVKNHLSSALKKIRYAVEQLIDS